MRYLEPFAHTVGVMQTPEALHRRDAERGEDLRAKPAPAEPLGHAQVEQGGGIGEVLQADQADAAVLGVIDPERGVVLVVPGASVDGVLHVVRGRVRPHVEGPGILREQGDERRAIISGRIRGREGDGHGGRVGEGGCRDAGESSHDTR